MVRVAGLALLVVFGAAVPAAANDGRAGASVTSASRPGLATLGATPLVQEPAMPVQLARASTGAQSPVPGAPATSARRDLATVSAAPATLRSARRDSGSWLAVPWLTTGTSGLTLLVSERLSFGVDYRHLEGEDLWRRHAEAASLDYDSHDFMLRAHWRF